MASLPQIRLEKLLDTFNRLQREKVIPYKQIKRTINKIRDYEYTLARPTATKFEYLKYVAFLTEFLEEVRQEKQKFHHLLHFKKVEHDLNSHMKRLLWKAIQRDKEDIKLWFDYIEFCKKNCRLEDVSKTLVAMLQIHPDKEEAWLSAAKYHFETMRSPGVARNLLLTGIRDHPDSIKLWREYFKFELLNADMVRKRMQVLTRDLDDEDVQNVSNAKPDIDGNDAVLSGKVAVLVFKKAIPLISKNQSHAKVFLEVVNVFDPELRVPVKSEMSKLMEENFPDQELMFDFKAQCFFDKHFVCHHDGLISKEAESIDEEKCTSLAESVYREGLEKVPSTKMWNLFVSFRLKVFSRTSAESSEAEQSRKLNELLLVFDECWRSELMSRNAFLEWILALEIKDDFDQIDKLMAKGCQKWSKYADIWYLRLSIMAKRINFKEELKRLFSRALKEIDYKDIEDIDESEASGLRVKKMRRMTIEDVWNFYLEWSSKQLHPTEVLKFIEKQFLELLIKGGGNLIIQRRLSSLLKPELLRKSIELKKDGLKSARSYYEKYKNHPPVVESFFQEMITIEKDQVPIDSGRVTNIYEDLIRTMGENDHSIWIDYCKFLYEGSKAHTVGLIHHRACKTLNPTEVTNFLSAYNLLQNNVI